LFIRLNNGVRSRGESLEVVVSPTVDGRAGMGGAGCGPVDREQALRQRVQERWAALIKKDWAVAYSFEAPVFRAAYPLEQYQAKFGKDIIWEAVTINHVLFEGDEVATVYVNVQYQPVRLIAGEAHRFNSQVTEKWIRSADQWWHASPTMGSKL
jgi:hypothetical protein